MAGFRSVLLVIALLASAAGVANSQVGVATGPAGAPLTCSAFGASAPFLRLEGYTELLSDILVSCTGGMLLTPGSAIPTADITVQTSPTVPITSRLFDSTSGLSEALLLIDEPGSDLAALVSGSYGPKAPQTLCAVQAGCPAFAQLDPSGVYPVASSTPTLGPSASNIYQGYVGASGPTSVTFYNVPILPPALQGVTRVFRITNLRASMVGAQTTFASAVISSNPSGLLPVNPPNVGRLGQLIAMTASVNPAPPGGQSPFSQCVPPQGPTLTAQLQFTESALPAQPFKTRVIPLTNTPWASTLPNTGTPGQNLPGDLYGGLLGTSESGLILPADSATVGDVTYTAGLADFGTRLKAVFTNIPIGVSLYVSTTNIAISGGATSPYAVLVATDQSAEANSDGLIISPLTGSLTGSDGLAVYPLIPDAAGTAAAVWEVVVADAGLNFNVYVTFGGTPPITGQSGAAVSKVALSFAPEPGGGTFTLPGGAGPLSSPIPRFAIVTPQEGQWISIGACGNGIRTSALAPFAYTIDGIYPSNQIVGVTTTPSGLSVSVAPSVTTPANGTWLVANGGGNALSIGVNTVGLSASPTPYTGNVQLSAPGLSDVLLPVSLTVNPAPVLSITEAHVGNFAQGQLGATYTVTVSNATGAGTTNGAVIL
jgi:hypothetical protein